MENKDFIKPTVESLLQDFPVKLEILVQWRDMDMAHHVNNVVYLKWFEYARVEYLMQLADYQSNLFGGVAMVIASQQCKYVFPVTFPDTVVAGIRITEVTEDRYTMECHMVSKKHQRLAAIASAVVVAFDLQKQQKTPLPTALKDKVLSLEQGKKD
jgi:acyl-CoA thioester hydrolase